MAKTAIAADFDQTLDTHLERSTQVAFNLFILTDVIA
jgi:hypothetical protein